MEKYVCKCGAESLEEHRVKAASGYGAHVFQLKVRNTTSTK